MISLFFKILLFHYQFFFPFTKYCICFLNVMEVTVDAPQPRQPKVYLYINGARQTLELPIPQFIGETLRISQVAERNLHPGTPSYDAETGQLADPMHIHCVFMQTDFHGYFNADAGFPIPILEGRVYLDGEPFSLGILSEINIPKRVSYIYPNSPKRISFEITRMANDRRKERMQAIRQAEMLKSSEQSLFEEVVDILKADKYRGSLASTYVQSLVMNSHHYVQAVHESFNGKWHSFLCSREDVLYLFKYSADDISNYSLQHTCHANELRVGLKKNMNSIIEGDRHRDTARHCAEKEVHNFLRTLLLTCGECDSQFLMKQLEDNCPAYMEFTHPSYNVLERVIRMNSDRIFDVIDDPIRGTVISIKRV